MVFAKTGESQQQLCGQCPSGWVHGDGIIVQSWECTESDSTTTEGTHGFAGWNITTTLPARVFVTRDGN